MLVLAIDPGNEKSAFCFIDPETLQPGRFGKVENRELLGILQLYSYDVAVIEDVASYGMPVGREVFDTCKWIGRFTQAAEPLDVEYIYRMEEKMHICHDSKAKDANIRRALIDRFAMYDTKAGKGTKNKPDWFYGFHADVWAAYAVGLTYIETKLDAQK